MLIEFLYSPDCPNADQARANLQTALGKVRASLQWREWNLAGSDTPEALRHFGSPTVLVDGTDIDAGPADISGFAGSCCRIYANTDGAPSGIPTVASIIQAIEQRLANDSRHP